MSLMIFFTLLPSGLNFVFISSINKLSATKKIKRKKKSNFPIIVEVFSIAVLPLVPFPCLLVTGQRMDVTLPFLCWCPRFESRAKALSKNLPKEQNGGNGCGGAPSSKRDIDGVIGFVCYPLCCNPLFFKVDNIHHLNLIIYMKHRNGSPW